MILDDVTWLKAERNIAMPWDNNCKGVDAQHELYVLYAIQAVLGGVSGGAEVLHCDASLSPQAAFKKREHVFTRLPADVPMKTYVEQSTSPLH